MPVKSFDEETIQRLFGHEAAEDEPLERLKQYYLKNKVYARITAELPLRILVGHKGTGKSALFKVAMSEDQEKGLLPILIKPDDIVEIKSHSHDFLQTIRDWKNGLSQIIIRKALQAFGVTNADIQLPLKTDIVNVLIDEVLAIDVKSLNGAKQTYFENFLETNKVVVYIDDLDRGWLSTKEDINRISALLNAVRDIINENAGLYFRIALRSDVYFLVRTSDESTDKIEGSVTWYDWTNHEILVMLIKRIETFFGRKVEEDILMAQKQSELSHYLYSVMQPVFTGKGKWNNAPIHRVLMSLIRKRPRDLVKLCSLAARKANEGSSTVIGTPHFEAIFEDYSQGRIQDTVNEYRSELPQVERLIMGMKPNRVERKASLGWVYNSAELLVKISNIIEQGEFKYTSGKLSDEKSLAHFLYKINFLTARKVSDTGVQRKYFEESRYLSGHFADFGYDWEVHPAYRWALQPDTIMDIFDQLDLTVDD